jgi:hypothetical protein
MDEILGWYYALATPFKIVVWVLLVFLGLAILKRLVKLAILITILIVLIIIAGALLL